MSEKFPGFPGEHDEYDTTFEIVRNHLDSANQIQIELSGPEERDKFLEYLHLHRVPKQLIGEIVDIEVSSHARASRLRDIHQDSFPLVDIPMVFRNDTSAVFNRSERHIQAIKFEIHQGFWLSVICDMEKTKAPEHSLHLWLEDARVISPVSLVREIFDRLGFDDQFLSNGRKP